MTAVDPSIVYGATQAAVLRDSVAPLYGQPSAETVTVPVDLLAMYLSAAHSAGRLDGIREINALWGAKGKYGAAC